MSSSRPIIQPDQTHQGASSFPDGKCNNSSGSNASTSSNTIVRDQSIGSSELTLSSKVDLKNDAVKLSKRHQKKIQKMRLTLDKSSSTSTSFTVLPKHQFNPRNDSYSKFNSNNSSSGMSGSSSSSKLIPSSLNLKEDFDKKLQIIEQLDNPFTYQPYYQFDNKPLTQLAKSSSALELEDLGGPLSNKNRNSNKRDVTITTLELGERSDYIEFSDDDVFMMEDDDTGCFCRSSRGGKNVKEFRWFNFLGVSLIAVGVLALLTISIVIAIVEGNRKVPPEEYELLTNYVYPQLSAIRTSLVDPDTPKEFHEKITSDGDKWDLVFSDEFNLEGRTFYPLEDQFFEGMDLHYLATNDLEWYSPDLISTANGTLNIRLDAYKSHGLFYRSGMLQSWNKMCYTQGLVEISARLPGSYDSKGFWPALWSLGNLARPGYMASTDGVWPYTYQTCDAGVTPNQSSPDGLSHLPGQRLNACVCVGEDHPNIGTGRGAPEFDILEGTFTDELPTIAQTLQVAPFDPWWIPDYEHMQINNKSTSYMNSYVGTPQQEAISVVTTLNEKWFEKNNKNKTEVKLFNNDFQTFSVEYRSDNAEHEDNYISFFTGADEKFSIKGSLLHPEGNIGWRQISKEPMSVVFNLGLSYSWSNIQWLTLNFPATLEIDYIRIYQPKGKHDVTCDPYDYPTSDYIDSHPNAYMNPNYTSWTAAGYSMPRNRLMNNCY